VKEDILLRRAKVLKKRRGHDGGQPPLPAEALATTLDLPLFLGIGIKGCNTLLFSLGTKHAK